MPGVIEPSVWWFDLDRSAIVLGSSQPAEHVVPVACALAGIDIVRRRSGGGAVLLQPGDALWVDVLIPSGHPRWTADINSSAWWLGEAWQRALRTVGVDGTTVHRGPMIRTPWSGHLCFAGVGGGEVLLGGRKVVGISQRRTRAGARFQCALYHVWRPDAHVGLFRQPGPTAEDLEQFVMPVPIAAPVLRQAFQDGLEPSR